jgi:hypothetical protein
MCYGLLSDNACFLEAEKSLPVIHGLTDDHMVQELDLKNPGSFANPAGQPHISFTWAEVVRYAARGIMQSIFSPPSRRSPSMCSHGLSRRNAGPKMLCINRARLLRFETER